jgi:hypothetical protein
MWYSLPPTALKQVSMSRKLAIGGLGESHRQILIPAGEVLRVTVPTIAGNVLVKLLVGKMLDQLRKHRAARVHPALWPCASLPPTPVSGLGDFKSFPVAKPLIPLGISCLRPLHAIFPGQQ